jgi:hypothetical protein
MNEKGLAAFKTLTAQDPLFAAEGLDADDMVRALDYLEIELKHTEQVWKTYSFAYRLFCMRYPFAKTIHPLPFLRSFVGSERRRRQFKDDPSFVNAQALIDANRATAEVLMQDLKRYKSAHLLIARWDKHADTNTYYFHKNMISFEEILAAIDALIENAICLQNEINLRQSILRGDLPSSDTVARVDPIPYQNDSPRMSEDMLVALSLAEKVALRRAQNVQKHGPYYYGLFNFDGEFTYHHFFVYTGKMKGRTPFLHLQLADQYYFLELSKKKGISGRGSHLFEPLIEQGITHWLQPPTMPYCSRDLSYYADLVTLADVEERPSLDRDALLSQKSSLLNVLFSQRWFSYYRQSAVNAIHKELPSPLFLLISRSYPSLFYLPFNRSVWRKKEKLVFLGGRFATKESPYKTYQDVRPDVSDEMLEKIFQGTSIRSEAWDRTLTAHGFPLHK